jgi:hypothetical protein
MYKITMPPQYNPVIGKRRHNYQSTRLSKVYGVSAKTIHDIWNSRTWRLSTLHLWHLIANNRFPNNRPAKTSEEDPFYGDWPHWDAAAAYPIENFAFFY